MTKATKTPSAFGDAEKYFPALGTLAKLFVLGLRITGSIFGLVFTGAPAYLIWRYVLPVFSDPAKTSGERWGAAAFGLFGLCFFAAGLFVLRDSIFRTKLPTPNTPRPAPTLPSRAEMIRRARYARRTHTLGLRKLPGGDVVISSANVYRMAAIGVGFFATFWNGLTFFALFDLKGLGSLFSIFQALFMLPFLVVGVGLAYVFFKLLVSLRQPTVEFRLPKAEFRRGDAVRVEIHLADPGRLARNLEVKLRKRYLQPEDEGQGLGRDAWIVEEKLLLRKEREELDYTWSDTVTIVLPSAPAPDTNEEWSEWSLEAKIETPATLPLYLAAALPYEVPET